MNTPSETVLKGIVLTIQTPDETLRYAVITDRLIDRFDILDKVPGLRGLTNELDHQGVAHKVLCEYPKTPPRARKALASWMIRKCDCATSIRVRC